MRGVPPWYVETVTADAATTVVIGPLETGFVPRVAGEILAAPPVPSGQDKLLRAAFAKRLPALAVLEPPELPAPRQVGGAPAPILRLKVLRPAQSSYRAASTEDARLEAARVARVSHCYGDVEVGLHDARDRPTFARNGGIVEVTRDRPAEMAAARQLITLGFEWLADHRPFGVVDARDDDFVLASDSEWIDVLYREVPKLGAAGWEVAVAEDFPIQLLVPDGDITAELRDGSDIDWFDLDLGVMVGGERIDLVPAILKELASPDFRPAAASCRHDDHPYYLELGDGRTLAVPAARIWPIIATLYELLTGAPSIPRRRGLV